MQGVSEYQKPWDRTVKSLVIQLWIPIFPDFFLESFFSTLNYYSRVWKTSEMNVSRRADVPTYFYFFLTPNSREDIALVEKSQILFLGIKFEHFWWDVRSDHDIYIATFFLNQHNQVLFFSRNPMSSNYIITLERLTGYVKNVFLSVHWVRK